MLMIVNEGQVTYVGRLNEQGDVRMLQLTGTPIEPPKVTQAFNPLDVKLDLVIPADQWSSTVAQVSRIGDRHGRHYAAQAFHQNFEIFR